MSEVREVLIRVTAPTGENAGQWAQTIADLVAAEHGQQMRLDIEIITPVLVAGSDTVENGAWHTVWLEGRWEWLTKKMTTERREYAADCVAAYSRHLATMDGRLWTGDPEGLRWWREDGR